jgi:DNA (cytosine-5)-methyltransferase 1
MARAHKVTRAESSHGPRTSAFGKPKIVSLFSGAGGLDWGFRERGFQIAIAFDISDAAVRTHKRNFPDSHAVVADLKKIGPGGVLKHVMSQIPPGTCIGVIGGPPCQGFSRANTRRRRNDPRNRLTSLYIRIVRRLQRHYKVEFAVFENVLGIRDRKHAGTYSKLVEALRGLGFTVTEKELCALDFGVPQNRQRVILSAMRKHRGYTTVRPRKRRNSRTVRDVIGHLKVPAFFSRRLTPEDIPVHPNHWTMQPRSIRFKAPHAVHVDGRSFKRLKWSGISPTVAFGNREIHIHPTGSRRISIYEAMLLQGFPSQFVLEGNLSEQVEQVSNAVPPPLARSVAGAVNRSMQGQ